MKKINVLLLGFFISVSCLAQDMKTFHLYNPEADAKKEIAAAVKEAKQNGKHVFIQVGGNWCIWCARFNDFITKDKTIDSLVQKNYVVYHLNFSKENMNDEVLTKYAFPQRFGFPVFLILNDEGQLIHTQNSAYLEEGKGYNKNKVIEFLYNWSPAALDPATYKH
ncbi:MAG: thioredoxin family protein [Chitinophagaceae bacterium]